MILRVRVVLIVIAAMSTAVPAAVPASAQNHCLYLEMKGDYVTIPHSPAISFTGSFTIDHWGMVHDANDRLEVIKRGNKNKGYGTAIKAASTSAGICSRYERLGRR